MLRCDELVSHWSAKPDPQRVSGFNSPSQRRCGSTKEVQPACNRPIPVRIRAAEKNAGVINADLALEDIVFNWQKVKWKKNPKFYN